MRDRKADSPLMTVIVYLLGFALLLGVFAVFYSIAATSISEQAITQDGRIDWEAGWLATALLATPYQGATFGEYLAHADLHDSDTQERVEHALRVFAAHTSIPGEGNVFIYILQDGAVGCAVSNWERLESGCGDSGVHDAMMASARDGEFLERRDDVQRLLTHLDTTYTGSNSGWALIPGSPQRAIIVIRGDHR